MGQQLIVIIYILAMTGILMYCLLQLTLAFHYLQGRKKNKYTSAPLLPAELPVVTVQLPIYNEKYVIQRLIDAICNLNYPKEKLEIQILDDSTDETPDLVKKYIAHLKNEGYNLQHIQRIDRIGFKAGALQEGLQTAKGEFIAIFDADFVPSKNFLRSVIPYFSDPGIGVVQSRWEHLNKNYSLLTRVQAFAIDVHFSIEQSGRNTAGYFINFNGTAGIWRKNCIIDAGGWSADTLTEDLDLSYRAQLKGWRFKYLEDLGSPAELPAEIKGYKTQQYRWNKGGAETARKMIPQILRSNVSFKNKIHGTAHLLNSSVYILIFTTIFLSIPLLWIIESSYHNRIYLYLSIFLLASISTAIVFFLALYSTIGSKRKTFLQYLYIFPLFLTFNLGMSLHNALAVIKGLSGVKSGFIRTPKFNIISKKDDWKGKGYQYAKPDFLFFFEGLLSIYFIVGLSLGIYFENYGMLPIHLMAALGFAAVFYHSIKYYLIQRRSGKVKA